MTMKSTVRLGLSTPLLLAVSGWYSTAWAQDFQSYNGAVRMSVQEWQQAKPESAGVIKPTYEHPYFLKHSLQRAWTNSKSEVEDILKEGIGKPDAIRTGQTLYDLSFSLAEIDEVEIASVQPEDTGPSLIHRPVSNDIAFRFKLVGNKISGTSTQPTFPKWGDPKFDIIFDMTLTLRLRVPTSTGPIGIRHARAQISNTKVHTTNLAAELGGFFGPFMEFFGGTNYPRRTEENLNKVDLSITRMLAGQMGLLNGMLQTWGFKGYRSVAAAVTPSDNGPELSLVMSKLGTIVTTGPGVIKGSLHWPLSYGNPVQGRPATDLFGVYATVQGGPSGDSLANRPYAGIWKKVSEIYTQGQEYRVDYTLANLPVNLPLQVYVVLKPGLTWIGAEAATTALALQLGWTGEITIKPPLPFKQLGPGAVDTNASVPINSLPASTPVVNTSVAAKPGAGGAPGGEVAINPQPLPPRTTFPRRVIKPKGGNVAINPQPLPPRIQTAPAPRSTARPIRHNPSGHYLIEGINFQVEFTRGLR